MINTLTEVPASAGKDVEIVEAKDQSVKTVTKASTVTKATVQEAKKTTKETETSKTTVNDVASGNADLKKTEKATTIRRVKKNVFTSRRQKKTRARMASFGEKLAGVFNPAKASSVQLAGQTEKTEHPTKLPPIVKALIKAEKFKAEKEKKSVNPKLEPQIDEFFPSVSCAEKFAAFASGEC